MHRHQHVHQQHVAIPPEHQVDVDQSDQAHAATQQQGLQRHVGDQQGIGKDVEVVGDHGDEVDRQQEAPMLFDDIALVGRLQGGGNYPGRLSGGGGA